ncbi:MAG: DUF4166 domain-containing protein [Pseudomonadota bacterium]
MTKPLDRSHIATGDAVYGIVLPDERFRQLMGHDAWNRLDAPVRARFARKFCGAASLVYRGMITHMRMHWSGRLLAGLCRIIGAPLPLDPQTVGCPAVVTVTEDIAGEGQFWSRAYGRKRGFPQVIHSSKRFAGRTGIEEYVGAGITIALTVHEEDGAMVFRSAGYRFQIGALRVSLPQWALPITVAVEHRDRADGSFEFSLDVRAPLLGEMIHQQGIFREAGVGGVIT